MTTIPPSLRHQHLMTLKLDVDSANSQTIGNTPNGRRVIAPVKGGSFAGEKLRGIVLPGGADWVRFRADGAMEIDVRLTLQSDDDVLLYLHYRGRFIASPEVMNQVATGASLDAKDYSLTTVANFECGDTRYAWLNDTVVIGKGTQSGFNPCYELYAIS